MYKIAYGKKFQEFKVDPDMSSDKIIKEMSIFSKISIENLVVCILNRPRHKDLIYLLHKYAIVSYHVKEFRQIHAAHNVHT